MNKYTLSTIIVILTLLAMKININNSGSYLLIGLLGLIGLLACVMRDRE